MDTKKRIFFVLGHYQPEDRIISILKYDPDDQGTWIHKPSGTRYKRSYWHQGIEAFFNSKQMINEPANADLHEWWKLEPVFNTEFLEVPIDAIKKHFVPEQRVAGIIEKKDSQLDDLEKKVKHIVASLVDSCKSLRNDFHFIGVTGSILWRGHSSRSDINLNIYGLDRCWAARRELADLAKNNKNIADDLKVGLKKITVGSLIQATDNVPSDSIKRKIKLKLTGFKPGIQIRWCLNKNEFPLKFGDESYHDLGLHQVKLKVTNDKFAIFYPGLVLVETLDGPFNVERILIYDTRCIRILQRGDVIIVRGLVQNINDEDKYQILIGSKLYSNQETIRLIKIEKW
ncbi:MAG: hypothetical protein ACTSWN_16925 [Promethearchaeota archaeon]